MWKMYKTELISHNTDTSYILKEAQAFDIILFNNKTWSLKTLFVKIGSNSGWNHAALVMDEPPFGSNNEKCKYLYEYAASGQPITFQKLDVKLNSERFNRIALIRFKNNPANFSSAERTEAKKIVINDFFNREGRDASDLSHGSDSISKKFQYNATNIMHRGVLSIALTLAIAIYFLSILSFLNNWFRDALLICLIATPLIIIMKYFFEWLYRKTNNETIKTQAICSSYPPMILKSIIYNSNTQKCEIEKFEDKWINGTPPSPKNLYFLAKSSEECIIYNYKKN
ncbi:MULTISPECIES: hypothetical protein [Klebsiella]|nr:hypothetical protein [Klebsiella oxytoca]MCW9540799.1 hypothetical protein [Klebsiella oxytoca]MCW9562050.1 hypothetical protein [Klebsiella oxytoca]MCW9572592.1 hypothetical protein [Klebsiella oxytoca]WBQ41133.1 hypothetical protein NDX50_19975 [Klebsiella oxytoca]CAA0259324.1 Uncharacterised protein [Klebsiella oxytoca]